MIQGPYHSLFDKIMSINRLLSSWIFHIHQGGNKRVHSSEETGWNILYWVISFVSSPQQSTFLGEWLWLLIQQLCLPQLPDLLNIPKKLLIAHGMRHGDSVKYHRRFLLCLLFHCRTIFSFALIYCRNREFAFNYFPNSLFPFILIKWAPIISVSFWCPALSWNVVNFATAITSYWWSVRFSSTRSFTNISASWCI